MTFCPCNPYFFYSNAIQPTAVVHCVSGQFSSPLHLNLIVAKTSRIELFLVGPEGLSLMKQINIYGRITVMLLFRLPEEVKDFLFVLTARYNAMILETKDEGDTLAIHTRAYGKIYEGFETQRLKGVITVIDPLSRIIAIQICEGFLTIIDLNKKSSRLFAVNIRLEVNEIIDLNFLHGCQNPTLLLLYQEDDECHTNAYELCLKRKELIRIPWRQNNVNIDSSIVIPVPEPLCGVLIIGQNSIMHHNGTTFCDVTLSAFRHTSIACYTKIDSIGRRYLLGDAAGRLFMVLLEVDENINNPSVQCIKIDFLGEVSVPASITYLDNGVIFVGSKMGDSQLVKLNESRNSVTGSYITILESFANLAPIVDMVIVDLEGQGQGQLITCSGGYKEGSLRIVRSGIEMQVHATIDLDGVKGLWSLKTNNSYVLVLSFVNHTRILSLVCEEVEETEVFGFLSDQRTLYCCNIEAYKIVQVMESGVRLICLESKQILSEWAPPANHHINNAAAKGKQLICTSGSNIFYFELSDQIINVKSVRVEHEVSCIDLSPSRRKKKSKYVAIGLWNDISVRILKLPSLEEAQREYLEGEILARSILFAPFDKMLYLLCALGDGRLFYFNFDQRTGELLNKKCITLGTQPPSLRLLKYNATLNVFVCSDRPAMIYSSNCKLIFSYVSLKNINYICRFSTQAYPNSVAIANNSSVSIAAIDEVQKLHIRSVPLYESPRRIAYQEITRTFGVISTRKDVQGCKGIEVQMNSASSRAQSFSSSQHCSHLVAKLAKTTQKTVGIGTEVEVNHLLLFNEHTFDILHAHRLLSSEFALSILSCKLKSDLNSYYVLGTGFVFNDENASKMGRIIVFQVVSGRLAMINELEVLGACYSLAEFNGKILASVNSSVNLYEWTAEKKLILECSHSNNFVALHLKTKGDFVLVGDLMHSITLLRYSEGSFKKIANDRNPNWMTAIEILDDETFLGAENSFNFFICQKDSSTAANDEDMSLMHEVSFFHLGDLVNTYRKGYLEMQPVSDTLVPTYGSVLFGTVNGAVGAISRIDKDLFDFLNGLEKKLENHIKSVGKIDHSFWRSFTSDVKEQSAEGFIDGELIECFLDLPNEEKENIVKGLKCPKSILGNTAGGSMLCDSKETCHQITVNLAIRIIEDILRLH